MNIAIQMLPLLCVVLAGCHIIDPVKPYFNRPHMGLHHLKDPKRPSNNRPINGDIFSYNSQHDYNHFYRDGNYNPAMNMYPYFGYPGPLGMDGLDNMGMPYGMPSIHNEFNLPGHFVPNYANVMGDHKNAGEKPDSKENNYDEDKNPNEKPVDKEHSQREENKSPVESQKLEDNMPPKTNADQKADKGDEKNKVDLNPNKDYLLVGNNGNGLYLLHESSPNTLVVPNNNPPAGNNVVYVPYNPQQPTNPTYQVVNGQPTSNIPLTPNRLDSNGFSNVIAPAQPSPNNKDPSYVLIYANGQLIQIPGVVINAPQNNVPLPTGNQGSNIVSNPNAPLPNYVYANPQNQGNNQVLVQGPNVAPAPNNIPTTGVFVQNPQMPNNNVVYAVSNQPSPVPQQVAQPNNMGNVYAQPTMMPSVSNQVPIVNTLNQPSANSMNNQGIQPAMALPVTSNQNVYQPPPSQEKEVNAVTPANNVPQANQPMNQQPIEPPPEVNDNTLQLSNALGAQPALMVSGFKETDNEDKDKKNDKTDKKGKKKEKKNKDKKKK